MKKMGNGEVGALRSLLALLVLLALLLGGCGYWAVEEAPVQVGNPVIRVTPTPTPAAQ